MTEDPSALQMRRSLDAAMSCYAAARFGEAVRIFDDVLPRLVSPEMPELWYLYGDALARTGRLEEAAKALTKAVQLAPEFWAAWGSLGGVYGGMDQSERARDALVRATRALDDPKVWSNLGVIERKLGNPEAAIACFQRAIATDPSLASAWHNLGNAWRDLGAWDDAVACFERIVELRPDNARDWMDLGVAYEGAKRRTEARQAFEHALALDAEHVDATYNLAMWHLTEGDVRRTRAWYRRLKTLDAASAREFADFVARRAGVSAEEGDRLLSA